jgi:hypothetical protein
VQGCCVHVYLFWFVSYAEARARGSVDALCYRPEGRRFEYRMRWILSIYLILPAALWPSKKNLPGGKKRPARRADKVAAICEPNV